jgi:hypothetical protein
MLTGFITFACNDPYTAPRASQAPSRSVEGAQKRSGFSFEGSIVTLPSGAPLVHLNGGGSFEPFTVSNGHGNGGFLCVADIATGPLAGCATGEGTHWDTEQLLQSSGFKCGGVAGEQGKTATTGPGVVVFEADFYRAGDGSNPSFRAKVFIADHDLAPDIDGVQNIWIEKVGCGTANVNFSAKEAE